MYYAFRSFFVWHRIQLVLAFVSTIYSSTKLRESNKIHILTPFLEPLESYSSQDCAEALEAQGKALQQPLPEGSRLEKKEVDHSQTVWDLGDKNWVIYHLWKITTELLMSSRVNG